jgi:RNA polymerase sigma-70 factor (ECF subfamily)
MAATARPAAAPRRRSDRADGSTDRALRVQALVAGGQLSDARDAFDGLVAAHQRRASRIAFLYLRDGADADEAVQDAFVKAFTRLSTYRAEHPFEVWFTRILVNACVDRQRARQRASRGRVSLESLPIEPATRRSASPEHRAVGLAWRHAVMRALDRLPERQRQVFVLCHLADHSPRDISMMTGMRESTVRVHLFRAVHKLRAALGAWRDYA